MAAATSRVLCIDDEQQMVRLLSRLLESWGYEYDTADTVATARARLAERAYALVLCDVNLPDGSGIEMLRELAGDQPRIATVMVTGRDDPALAQTAFELGAYGYVIKPFDANELRINVVNAIRRRALELESLAYRELLEMTVRQRTTALRQAVAQLEGAQARLQLTTDEMVRRLSLALESRDVDTSVHTERVSRCALLIARELGFDDAQCEMIRVASPLHDVGKIAVPDSILLKRGMLTISERAVMQDHTVAGHRILSGSESELLELAATIALTHHEHFDGSGYPQGLVGSAIPIEGRIVAVADVFDALTSERPYHQSMSDEEAVEILSAGRGTQFDPEVVDCFVGSAAIQSERARESAWRADGRPAPGASKPGRTRRAPRAPARRANERR